ncbi:alpha/beta hydrolase family protein [Alkaliphilus peptidifermentans]|uniref:Lysophospholipase, alpha-beta hydrolase superfamily n=1 Tax=Alkaliphilus peptidifermentans DSM 18978 TaxID=1120976 RepID=A0A1G5ISW5_9FIRM|nr:alpha/beta fold hydrolase [Alkaliphilus peptidifermentans]SCY79143.1 Lysophospholipase, alpha-beta hydrolase superfamily [Alkaliphilus peptidifermentans DSM 18978]
MAYRLINKIPQFNFQINRVLTYGEIGCNEDEVIEATSKIESLQEWYEAWTFIAERAEKENRFFHAAYYYRMAEFFLKKTDLKKLDIYNLCIKNYYKAFDAYRLQYERYDVPYGDGSLNCLRITASEEKAIVLVCGGYDSFIEEFVINVNKLTQFGYTVILFEGPGQGRSLEQKLHFIHNWEVPTRAVLDYFNINNCAMIGISWGGYLALRSAAFEKRISATIAYNIMYDGYDVMTNIFPPLIKKIINLLYRFNQKNALNMFTDKIRRKSIIADWALSQGMYITGTNNTFEFYKEISKHTLKNICNKIDQKVLLTAGEKDHYIPLTHFEQLKNQLFNAKLLTCRLFTESEGGEQHCQVGNHLLAVDTIINWLDNYFDQNQSDKNL